MAVITESREPANEVKFLIDSDRADAIADWARAHVGPDPYAQDAAGIYHTTSLYFDTKDLDVLQRRGSYARSKYRVRRYGRADCLFLERKLKKSGVVTKKRSIIGLDELGLLDEAAPQKGWNGYWFHRRILARELRPVCQISYRRLARVTHTESGTMRLTMDRDLRARRTNAMRFEHDAAAVPLSEKNPILELKFRKEMPALFHQLIDEFKLSPATVSKYRLGAAALGFLPPLCLPEAADGSAECETDEQPPQPRSNVRTNDPRYSDWKILRRMALQARPYWLRLALIFILTLATTPLSLMTPLPVKIVVDSVISHHPLPKILRGIVPQGWQQSPTELLTFAIGLMLAVKLLSYLLAMGSSLLEAATSEGMVLDFRTKLFANVQRLSLRYHDSIGTSDSTFRIQYDAPSVQQLTVNGIIPLVSSVMTLVGMMFVMARLDMELAIVSLGIAPVLYWLARSFRGRLRQKWKDVKRLESAANSVVQEVLSSIRVVKAFGREGHEEARFFGRATHRKRELLRVSFLQNGFDLLVGMTLTIGTAGTLYLGVRHVQSGLLSLGDLILVLAYISQLYDPLKAISKKMTDLQSALASAERAFLLLDEAPEVAEHPHAKKLRRAQGEIRFEDVSFAYDGEHKVLESVSLTVPVGTRVGIQGKTGAGKSTLMSLLTRFYDVSGGRILIDGVDIREYRLADFRDQFGIVLQDSILFSTAIAENIAYSVTSATEAQIVDAARLANAHDFISALPDGYNTLVGERGMRLSGGERQRIALARAFLRNAPILILDEPTSSLDVGTEAIILEALERLMHGRTTFVIAHRLGTLDHCDMRLEILDRTLIRREALAAGAQLPAGQ